MALDNNFISFQPVVEAVYRRAGYQQIDWTEAIEVIGETIRLIGVLPAFKEVTTNGINDNPTPLEVVDYRVALPSECVNFKTARKVILSEEENEEGGTDLLINRFVPMIQATNLFYQTPMNNLNSLIPAGTYNYVSMKQTEIITLSGTSGTAIITEAGGLTKTVSFVTSLTVSAANFVTANAAAYLAQGITLTSDEDTIIFVSESGEHFSVPIITNSTGNLTGTVTETTTDEPVTIYSPQLKSNIEVVYEYKINNGYIYTNFETGFIECIYTAFVTDEHGYPMIPDDQRYIEAVRWSLIENIDYKKWRVGEITDKVYNHSLQQKDWYVASAKSKANMPSIDQMESIKEMWLRSIPKVREHDTYFKTSNVAEKRYTQNYSPYNSRYYRRNY